MKCDFLLFDGKLVPSDSFVFNESNRAFRYGDGLFETIKVSQEYPLFYRSHYSRFVRGMFSLGFAIPEEFTFIYFFKALNQLIHSANFSNGILRVQAFRKGEGTYLPNDSSFSWIVEYSTGQADEAYFPSMQSAYKVDFYHGFDKVCSPISYFKSCNSQLYVLAAQQAKKMGVDNLILLNKNHIVETIAENIFIYNQGVVKTPPITDGPVDGIMRSVIKKIIKWNNIDFEEASITKEELLQAQELFVTNSIKGIQSITSIKNITYTTDFSRGLFAKLNERVAQIVQHKQ